MPYDQFETRNLLPIAEELREPRTFFQSMLFGSEEISESETVDLDKDDMGLQLADFVEPGATAKPTEKQNWDTHTFKIPYMKPLESIKASELTGRMPGETIYGGRSMAERHRWLAARTIAGLESRIQRRIEVMCAQIVANGQIPILDENGNTLRSTIVFPRSSRTMQTLAGGERWTESTADIVGDIEEMEDISGELTGLLPDFAYCSPEVWRWMRANTKLLDLLDNVSMPGAFAQLESKAQAVGVRSVGRLLGKIPLFVVNTKYRRGTTEVRTVGARVFGMASTQAAGRVLYGPVHDFNEAGDAIAAAVPRYPTSWVTRNPSAQQIQVHSAPLPFTPHWNAFQTWNVID